MPPKKQADQPKATLSDIQKEQLAKAREKGNATRQANALIRQAEKKKKTELDKLQKQQKLKEAQDILSGKVKPQGVVTPSTPVDVKPNQKGRGYGETLVSPGESAPPEIQEEPEEAVKEPEPIVEKPVKKATPKKPVESQDLPTDLQNIQVKPSHSAKDQYYQEKLKYLKNKMKQDQEPKPEKKEPKYDARDDHELIARNRLAHDMFQEQRRHFWKTHMKDENYPQDYW